MRSRVGGLESGIRIWSLWRGQTKIGSLERKDSYEARLETGNDN